MYLPVVNGPLTKATLLIDMSGENLSFEIGVLLPKREIFGMLTHDSIASSFGFTITYRFGDSESVTGILTAIQMLVYLD